MGMGAGLLKLWDRWRNIKKGPEEPLWDRTSAEAKAREVVARAYGLGEQDLELTADRLETGERQWTFEFEHDQTTYTTLLRDNAHTLISVEIHRRIAD